MNELNEAAVKTHCIEKRTFLSTLSMLILGILTMGEQMMSGKEL